MEVRKSAVSQRIDDLFRGPQILLEESLPDSPFDVPRRLVDKGKGRAHNVANHRENHSNTLDNAQPYMSYHRMPVIEALMGRQMFGYSYTRPYQSIPSSILALALVTTNAVRCAFKLQAQHKGYNLFATMATEDFLHVRDMIYTLRLLSYF